MAYYRVTFRISEEAELQYEFIYSDESIEHIPLDIYFDDETEILEIRNTTEDEVIAYKAGKQQGWEDFEDYLLIEDRMKKHNGHVFQVSLEDESLDAVEQFVCGICQEIKEKEDLSGKTVPVGTYETPWDVCKGCASK